MSKLQYTYHDIKFFVLLEVGSIEVPKGIVVRAAAHELFDN